MARGRSRSQGDGFLFESITWADDQRQGHAGGKKLSSSSRGKGTSPRQVISEGKGSGRREACVKRGLPLAGKKRRRKGAKRVVDQKGGGRPGRRMKGSSIYASQSHGKASTLSWSRGKNGRIALFAFGDQTRGVGGIVSAYTHTRKGEGARREELSQQIGDMSKENNEGSFRWVGRRISPSMC